MNEPVNNILDEDILDEDIFDEDILDEDILDVGFLLTIFHFFLPKIEFDFSIFSAKIDFSTINFQSENFHKNMNKIVYYKTENKIDKYFLHELPDWLVLSFMGKLLLTQEKYKYFLAVKKETPSKKSENKVDTEGDEDNDDDDENEDSETDIEESPQEYSLTPLKSPQELNNIQTPQYSPKIEVGEGTYGSVYYNPTERIVSKEMKDRKIEASLLREIAIYRYLSGLQCCPNMLGFNLGKKPIIYLEPGKHNLCEYFMTRPINNPAGILLRIAKCMQRVARHGIIHCDLKPQNIILVKNVPHIIDWGISEIDFSRDSTKPKCAEVQTLWYRAPEVIYPLIGSSPTSACYTEKIDIFSLGIIFLETILGRFIMKEQFNPIHAQFLLSRFLGIKCSNNTTLGETKLKFYLAVHSEQPLRETIKEKLREKYFPGQDDRYHEEFLDLVAGMLEFNPKYRLTYEEIVIHPYFQHIFRENVPDRPRYGNNMPKISNILTWWDKRKSTSAQREKILTWLQQAVKKYKYNKHTLCLAIQLVDLCVVKATEGISSLSQVAFGVLYIAICLCENIYIDMDEIGDEKKVLAGTVEVMKILDGNVLIPSLYSYCVSEGEELTEEELMEEYLYPDVYAESIPGLYKKLYGIMSEKRPLDCIKI